MPSYGSFNQVKQLNERNKIVKPHLSSTGAKTAQGKAKISQNARKHSDLSKTVQRANLRRFKQNFQLLEKWQNLLNSEKCLPPEIIAIIVEYFDEFHDELKKDKIIINGQKITNYLPSSYQK
jgi:hypothetical protein